MKAWRVSDNKCECGTAIVFAETRAKAIYAALTFDDQFEDCKWIDMWAKRFSQYDQYYNGKTIVDWNDLEDRVRLVKEFGWCCAESESWMCTNCPAKEWCEEYKSTYGQEDP